jgi:hypothetical protein
MEVVIRNEVLGFMLLRLRLRRGGDRRCEVLWRS